MDFLKKHYEKLVLVIALAAVALAAFLLLREVDVVKEQLDQALKARTTKKGAAFEPLNLSTNEAALKRVTTPVKFVFDGEHNTFNPGTWDKTADGFRRKSSKGGLGGLNVTRVIPLNLIVSYVGVASVAETPRYQFSFTREYEKLANKRRAVIASLSVGTKNDVLFLRDIKGPKEEPTELICELIESGERFVLSKERDFRKPLGYAVDLRHENKDFPAKRVDDSVTLSGVTYKIVAIGKDELVVSAPNQVRTTIPAVMPQQ